MQYRTFDGKSFSFNGGKCEYVLVSNCLSNGRCDLMKASFTVKVKNTRCVHSYEAFMCKQVSIDMLASDGTKREIVMMQSVVRVKQLGIVTHVLNGDKGDYKQPRKDVVPGVEIFKVG